MHVRVRLLGKPEAIVVVESKLTKIEKFRRVIRDKFDVDPKLQRLFYGGKLLEDGYTFHDYNIKLNDVIQLMVQSKPIEDPITNKLTIKLDDEPNNKTSITYNDADSRLYEVGDLVDMRDRKQGAWFEGKVVRIVHDPDYVLPVLTNHDTNGASSDKENDSENKPPVESEPKSSLTKTSKNKAIADYFTKINKLSKIKQSDVSSSSKQAEDPGIEHGLLYQILLDSDSNDTEPENFCKLKAIRPRARKEIDVKELKPGQKVMINHNTENHSEKGYWYDFKVDEVRKLRTTYDLIGTLYLGPDAVPQNETKAKAIDKIFCIEEVVPLADRSDEYKKLMKTPTELRSSPLNCLTCRDDEDAKCKDCGCFLCLGKEAPEKIILCDECNYGYHMGCLSPPLSELPEDDWYCPSCKRDSNIVVAPGAAKQSKKTSKNSRDWGRGMACVGKTKTCSMPANHFGPIPGIEVGMCWRFRIQLSESGVHRPPVSGIHGRDVEGAYSIVLSGGYEDDYDNGDEFTYTGSGGRDLSGNKRTAEQSCDQTLTRENKALARNCAVKQVSEEGGDAGESWREGRPVRVVRSFKMKKHFPQYAPEEGIRYDGIYKVAKYYPEKGKSGFRVWKYLLKRDDPAPAPWEPHATQYPIVYPDGYLEAEAEKKALKQQKGGAKATKGSKKRALRENNHSSDSEADKSQDSSPAPKKRKTRSSVGTPEIKKKDKTSKKADDSVTESPKAPKTPKIASIFTVAKKSPKSPKTQDKPAHEELDGKLLKEELEAIKADTLNVKLWEECLVVCKASGKKEFVEQVTQLFLCIICQDLAADPVTTSCLHNFCMGCIKLAFKATGAASCPCCRRDLSKESLEPNEPLRAALRSVMPGYDAGKKLNRPPPRKTR